jgi:hypothetical protein
MKKIITIIFSSCFLFLAAWEIQPSISVEGSYSSNLLSLSADQYQSYLDGEIGSYYDVETADDFVSSIGVNLKGRRKILGHTNITNLSLDNDLYTINDLFNQVAFGFETRQFFNRYWDLSLAYSYHPEIYVQSYISVWDDERHHYTYSKNNYSLVLNHNLNQQISLRYELDSTQRFYNEYFTEYDANDLENAVRLIWRRKNFETRWGYGYKYSVAQAEEAFAGTDYSGVIKDNSYESSKFRFSLIVPQIFQLQDKAVRFYAFLLYEKRYFQSDYPDDTYHYQREADRFSFSSYLRYPILENMQIKLLGKYQKRLTESIYQQVADEKTYDAYQVGLGLDFDL